MCGIVGTFRYKESSALLDPQLLMKMRDTMIHRGPDGAGLWLDQQGYIGLGHRRLSIIDLDDRSAQPMISSNGRFALTYNGEIYNYKEVRSRLERLGVRNWRTASDTEVLLNAFNYWGIECLQYFRGVFAFGLWDELEQTLWLVRDRIGVKPIYYSENGGRISFASEIKALLQDPLQPREMDETSVFHFLSLMTTPAPHTMFRGIKKVPGGCWLRIKRNGSVKIHRYWDALDEATIQHKNLPTGRDEIVAVLEQELETAVALRGVADVPVGVFLSGGIDSSTNAALFSNSQNVPIRTFSIGYEGKFNGYQNELDFARLVANQIDSDHHEKLLKVEDLIDFLPHMIYLQDEPIADPVCFPVHSVSELARQNGIKVAQVGEGADELFAGYTGWHRILRFQNAVDRYGFPASALSQVGLTLLGKNHGQIAETLRRRKKNEPFFLSGAELLTGRRKQTLLSNRMRRKFADKTSSLAVEEIHARFMEKASEQSALNWMTYVDLNLRLPELLLMRVDKMSMGASLECREPFLDHHLVGLALAIPTKLKLAENTPKSLLKRAVRGKLPDKIIHRKKQGFGVPLKQWVFGRLEPIIRSEIDCFVAETDVLDASYVNTLFTRGDSSSLWALYNLAAWHRQFIKQQP